MEEEDPCICGAVGENIELSCWFCQFRLENQHLEWVK